MTKQDEKSTNLPDLPRSILYQGQITIRVGTAEAREKMQQLMKMIGEEKVSRAVWKAIDFYLEHAPKKD